VPQQHGRGIVIEPADSDRLVALRLLSNAPYGFGNGLGARTMLGAFERLSDGELLVSSTNHVPKIKGQARHNRLLKPEKTTEPDGELKTE
jgi:hypothetical protein